MSRFKDKNTGTIAGNAAYFLMRRGQAVITQRLHFSEGELCAYRDRDSFQAIAKIATAKYFHQSTGELLPVICDLYTDYMVTAPIIQRLPYTFRVDWTRGHVLSWIRANCNDNIKRYYFSAATYPRTFDPDLLRRNLDVLGVHDSQYIEVLTEQYKRHYGGACLRSDLAHRLFDPILLLNQEEGFRLRVGNSLYRLEKTPFPGCTDLRVKQAKVLGSFRIRHITKKGGTYLEIILTHDAIDKFKQTVCSILDSSASPRHKVYVINDKISDFMETLRFARSAWQQALDLQNWLVCKMRPLYGALKDVKRREKGLRGEYTDKRQDSLFLPRPNFFWNPRDVELSDYLRYMSPYREKDNG